MFTKNVFGRKCIRIALSFSIILVSILATFGNVKADVSTLQGNLTYNWVRVQNFAALTDVSIDIDGSLFSVTTDENGTGWLNNRGEIDIDLVVGTTITATQGSIFKELTLEDISVNVFDVELDVVKGTAPDGRWLNVHVHDNSTTQWYNMDVQAIGGNWTADFRSIGVDLYEEMNSQAMLFDLEDDATVADYDPPGVHGNLTSNWIRANSFTPNSSVTIDIYDADDNPLLTKTVPTDGSGDLWIEGHEHGVNLQPFMVIEVSDSVSDLVKELTLEDISLDVFDIEDDLVQGTAPAGRLVNVHVYDDSNNQYHEMDVLAESDESWTANFGTIGVNLHEGFNPEAMLFDLEGNATVANLPDPPSVQGSLTGNWIQVNNFTPNSSATIEIYESEGGSSLLDQPGTFPIDNNGYGSFDGQEGVNLQPGVFIQASDDTSGLVKELTLENISLDVFDIENDQVQGTAPAGAWVNVEVYDESINHWYHMYVEAIGGDWTADFGAETEPVDLNNGMVPTALLFDIDGDATLAQLPDPPSVQGNLTHDWIQVDRFTPNSSATIEIYDAGGSPLLTKIVLTDWNGRGWFNRQEGINLQPGTFIRASDDTSGLVKELTLENISVDVFDIENDLVQGTAPEDAWLFVNVHDHSINQGYGMDVQADSSGNWTADFGTISVDLYEGLNPQAMLFDIDGDATSAELPQPPSIQGNLTYHFIQVDHFTPNSSATIEIYDVGGSPLITKSVPTDGYGRVCWFEGHEHGFYLQPGTFIRVSDDTSGLVKELTLENITLNVFNMDLDVVKGTAPVNALLNVNVYDESNDQYHEMDVQADSSGNWIANFGTISVDLHEGFYPKAMLFDDDYDSTSVDQTEPPWVAAVIDNDDVVALSWPMGAELTMWLDNDNDLDNGFIYSETMTTTPAPWGPMPTAIFDLSGLYDLQPGQVVTVSGADVTKSLLVTHVEITSVDMEADSISGVTSPNLNSKVLVSAIDESGIQVGERWIDTDGDGYWTADFSVPGDTPSEQNTVDISFGYEGWANDARDDDGDYSEVWWYAEDSPLEPWVAPVIDIDDVIALCWPMGTEVTMWLDNDNDIGNGFIYSDTMTMTPAPWGMPIATFDLSGLHDLQTGQFVTVSGSGITKTHEVTYIEITSVDIAADTVSGIASKSIEVRVGVADESGKWLTGVIVNSDEDGIWIADFTGVVDIVHGYSGYADDVWDDDGDYTEVKWYAEETPIEPWVAAVIDNDDVVALDWPMDTEVTMWLDNDFDLENDYIYTETMTVAPAPWGGSMPVAFFDLSGLYDLQPGHVVTVIGSGITKTLLVTHVEITSVDIAADIVSGVASPNLDSKVYVVAFDQSNEWLKVERWVDTDGDGKWTADFSIPGDTPSEQNTVDILSGYGGWANDEWDYDGDYSEVGWYANEAPAVDAGGPYETNENNPITLTPVVSDAEGDPLTYAWTYAPDEGNCSFGDPNAAETTFTCTLLGEYTVTLEVSDGINAPVGDSAAVTVLNLAPDVVLDPLSGVEGSTLNLAPYVNDAEGDELTFAWSYEIDEGECAFGDPTAVNTSFTCQDDGEFTLTLTVSDGVNEPVIASATASIANANPEVGAVNAPIDPIEVGVTVEASASFTDAGTLDTHTSTWEWGDGSFTDGLVSEENGSGTTVGSYAYSVPGVYTLVATVEDDDGGWDSSEDDIEMAFASSYEAVEDYQYLVIYDPEGGFVTGGGWINSPAGAYAPDGSLTGKATFGFVSKYKKGADVPTGVTEFHFRMANLKFKSSSYDWLVVAGKKAMFKGEGTINGEGNYRFMLSCNDGDLQGGDGIDRFRIKIWDRDTDAMVYDNQMGEVDDAEPATALGGGSIVIHKAK